MSCTYTPDYHSIYLGDSHVVDVKKDGLYIGIYVITQTKRRRGVILPLTAWRALLDSTDIINLGIAFQRGDVLSPSITSSLHDQYYGCTRHDYNHDFWTPSTADECPTLLDEWGIYASTTTTHFGSVNETGSDNITDKETGTTTQPDDNEAGQQTGCDWIWDNLPE